MKKKKNQSRRNQRTQKSYILKYAYNYFILSRGNLLPFEELASRPETALRRRALVGDASEFDYVESGTGRLYMCAPDSYGRAHHKRSFVIAVCRVHGCLQQPSRHPWNKPIYHQRLQPRNAGTRTTYTALCDAWIITLSFLQHHNMRWLPTPSFLLSTTSSALRFSSPCVLRRPSTLVQQQGLLALGLTVPFLFHHQHHHHHQHCPLELSQRLSPSFSLRAHSTAAFTLTMATREEKDRYVRTLLDGG